MAKRDVLMVDKDLYDTMVAAFVRVKEERYHNKQLADNLVKQISSIEHSLAAFNSKIVEASSNIGDLQETIHCLSDEHVELRIKLNERIEPIGYGITELEDKVRKIGKELKQLELNLRPLQDAYKG